MWADKLDAVGKHRNLKEEKHVIEVVEHSGENKDLNNPEMWKNIQSADDCAFQSK